MLDVYLAAERAGALERQGPTRFRFRYADDAVARHGQGALLLSASLPVQSGSYPSAAAKPFFEGLLPEGTVRTAIARALGLSEENTFGLLEALGEDCAGAVVVLPEGSPAADSHAGSIVWLDEEELAAKLLDLPRAPLGIAPEQGIRLSLAGVQRKLVVTRTPSGRFGQPKDGAPSTHIMKPAQEEYAGIVANEAFCLRVARCLGLEAAEASPMRIGGIECLLVARYDRSLDASGRRIQRLHQEDFCQALGILPAAKYEADGGPSAPACVELIREVAGPRTARSITMFVDALLVNFALGNSDAHGKNFALLYETAGAPRLAPLYDLVSTTVYPWLTPRMAMAIGGAQDPDAVDREAWLRLADECRLGRALPARAAERAAHVVRCCRAVRDMSLAEGWHHEVVDGIVAIAERRAAQLAA